MFKKIIFILANMGLVCPAFAFPCFLTVAKNNCWLTYNVTISAIDTSDGRKLAEVIIPEGSSWGREKFECEPGLTLEFKAQFTPVFWEKDQGKIYSGKSYWPLPKEIKKGTTAWNITLCFPNQFSEVPLPPQATDRCICDLKSIPPIKPQ